MRREVATTLLALVSCTPPGPIFVDLPPDAPSTGGVLIALDTGAITLVAVDLGAGGAVRLPDRVEPEESAELHAWVYDRPLSEVGLAPGIVEQDASGAAIPASSARWRAAIEDQRFLGWEQQGGALPEELAGLRVRTSTRIDSRCVDFKETAIVLPARDNMAEFAMALDERSAMVVASNSSHDAYRIYEDGRFERVIVVGNPAGGFRDPTGQLWIGSPSGRLNRATLQGTRITLALAATSSSSDSFRWFDGVAGPGGVELVMLSPRGGVFRYLSAANRIERLHRFTLPDSFLAGGITAAGPGDTAAVIEGVNFVARIRDGVATEEALPEGIRGPTAVAHVPGLGLVAGMFKGEILFDDGSGWQPIPGGSPFALSVESITPWENGFLAAGVFGQFAQYVIGAGFCPKRALSAYNVRFSARAGRKIILVGSGSLSDTGLPVSLLDPGD